QRPASARPVSVRGNAARKKIWGQSHIFLSFVPPFPGWCTGDHITVPLLRAHTSLSTTTRLAQTSAGLCRYCIHLPAPQRNRRRVKATFTPYLPSGWDTAHRTTPHTATCPARASEGGPVERRITANSRAPGSTHRLNRASRPPALQRSSTAVRSHFCAHAASSG